MNYAKKTLNESLDILVPFYKEAGMLNNMATGFKNMFRAADNVTAAASGEIAETATKSLSKTQAKKQVKGAFARAQKKNPDLKFNEFSQKTTGTAADPQYKEFLSSQAERSGQVYKPNNTPPDLSGLKNTSDPNDLNMTYPTMDKVKKTVTTPPPATRTPSPGQQQMVENNPLAPSKPTKKLSPKQETRAAYQKAVKEQPGLKFKDFVNRSAPNDLNMGYGSAPDVVVPNTVPTSTLKQSPAGLPAADASQKIVRSAKNNTPKRTIGKRNKPQAEVVETKAPDAEVSTRTPEATQPPVPTKTPETIEPPVKPTEGSGPKNDGTPPPSDRKESTPKNSESFIKKNWKGTAGGTAIGAVGVGGVSYMNNSKGNEYARK